MKARFVHTAAHWDELEGKKKKKGEFSHRAKGGDSSRDKGCAVWGWAEGQEKRREMGAIFAKSLLFVSQASWPRGPRNSAA